ncbi:MAG TPA: ArsC family (seleno)protein [Gemmataceae bacterium]|nr:ArsC family (seleno)protein [Gemmataceae bacterium]
MSCKRAQGFLEANRFDVEQQGDAKKERRGRAEALALAKAADRVIVAKGKNVVEFDMKADTPDDNTLVDHLLGPTGNLRAPAIRKGRTLLVGFSDEAYRKFLSN